MVARGLAKYSYLDVIVYVKDEYVLSSEKQIRRKGLKTLLLKVSHLNLLFWPCLSCAPGHSLAIYTKDMED